MMFARTGRHPLPALHHLTMTGCGLCIAAAALLVGCATAGTAAPSASAPASPSMSPEQERLQREVEQRYVVGPAAARQIGYRVDWQYPNAGRNLKMLEVQGDSVFALDQQNFLTRLDRNTGARIWRVAVAEPMHQITGITYMPEMERVYVVSGGSLIVVDAANGSQVGLQRLDRIANTAAVRYGDFLLYGSQNGQLIWHSHAVAFRWRAYQISPTIHLDPIVHEDVVVVVGANGRVAALDARTAGMHWNKQLLSSVSAPPAIGSNAVYVAGLDQHLWAFDIGTGREVWRHLTASPLEQPPVHLGDHVFIQIPQEGLVCFEARPQDARGGRIAWRSPQARGNVIAGRGGMLLLWDRSARRASLAEIRGGGIASEVQLSQAARLVSVDQDGTELYANSEDGRIVRLLPRN